jgi:hypothetical protein
MIGVQPTIFDFQAPMIGIQPTIFDFQAAMIGIQLPIFDFQAAMIGIQLPIFGIQAPMIDSYLPLFKASEPDKEGPVPTLSSPSHQSLHPMAQENNTDKNKGNSGFIIGGLLFVGFMMLGKGIGAYMGEQTVGQYVGMGLGFVAMAGVIAYQKMR